MNELERSSALFRECPHLMTDEFSKSTVEDLRGLKKPRLLPIMARTRGLEVHRAGRLRQLWIPVVHGALGGAARQRVVRSA